MFEQLAQILADKTKSAGGTPQQRAATANLWCALLHYRLVEFVRELKRQDIEASIYDDTAGPVVMVDGATIEVRRFPRSEAVVFKFSGFRKLIPWTQSIQEFTPGALSQTEIEASVEKWCVAVGELLKARKSI